MKRLLILLLLALLLIPTLSVGAVPAEDLTALAEYFPADTQVYFSIRTDDEFISAADALIATLDEQYDGEILRGRGLQASLDEFAQDITRDEDTDFETAVRPWLGDTLAFTVIDMASDIREDVIQDVIIATEISDNVAVEELLDTLVVAGDYDKTTNLRYVLYLPKSEFDQVYLLRQGVLLAVEAGDNPERIILDFDTSLTDQDGFLETVNRLPADSYNALFYADAAPIVEAIIESSFTPEDMPMMSDFDVNSITSLLGPQVLGFTLLDGNTLVMDYAHSIPEASLSEDAIKIDPLDAEFARYIPTDAFLSVHDTNLGPTILYLMDGVEAIGDVFDNALPAFNPEDPREEDALRAIDDAMTFIRLTYRGLTGVPLEESIGWMTGNFVNYIQLEQTETGIFFDVGFIVENTDQAGVDGYLAATITLAESLELDYMMEDGVISMPFLRTLFSFGEIPTTENQDFLVGANDEVLVVGTRVGVESALVGEASAMESDVYQTASAYFLPETQTLWYMNVEALRPMMANLQGIDRDLDDILFAISPYESGSITATYTEDGEGLVRFALTLAE